MAQSWRIEPLSAGALAWIYLRPHEVEWSVPAAELAAQGYSVTEERQNLVDEELGACIRYLAVGSGGSETSASTDIH